MQQYFGLFRKDNKLPPIERMNVQNDEEKEPPITLQTNIIEEDIRLEIQDKQEAKVYQKGSQFGIFFLCRQPISLQNENYILGETVIKYQSLSIKLILEYNNKYGDPIIALQIYYIEGDMKSVRINGKLILRQGFFALKNQSEETFTLQHRILQTISIEITGLNRNIFELIIEANIDIDTYTQKDVLSQDFASSGLENPGNTCYMNSILQIMQHLGALRKIVYSIENVTKDRFPASLQELFYNMSDKNYTTCRINQLLRSFDWTNEDAWVQQDVQEFFMMFLDALDNKLRKLNQDQPSEILKLFQGKLETTTKCIQVDDTSKKIDSFTDIQLEVGGINDLKDSLRKYTSEESLDGENKFQSEYHKIIQSFFQRKYGLQIAQKRTVFVELPPVLVFHLKRFTYQMGVMKKILQKFEFPQNLSMSEFTKENQDINYTLYGILTHLGDQINQGHYIAFIRDAKADHWVSFNDYSVKIVTSLEALEGNYGGQYSFGQWEGKIVEEKKFRRQSAYMLLYVRKDLEKEILFPDNIELPRWLKDQIQEKHQLLSRQAELRSSLQIYTVDYEIIREMKNTRGILINFLNSSQREQVWERIKAQEILLPLNGTLDDHIMKKFDDKILLLYRSYQDEQGSKRVELIHSFDQYRGYKTTFAKEAFQINKCVPIIIRIKQFTCDQSEGIVIFLKVIRLQDTQVLNPIRVQSFLEMSSITGQLIRDYPECYGTVPYIEDSFGELHEFSEELYTLTIENLFSQWKIFSICTLVLIDSKDRNEIFKKYYIKEDEIIDTE